MPQPWNGTGRTPAAGIPPPEPPTPAGWPADLAARLRRMLAAPAEAFRPPLSAWVWLAPLILLALFSFGAAMLSADLWIQAGLDSNPAGAAALEDLSSDKMTAVRLAMAVGALAMTWVAYIVPAVFFWFGLNFVLGGRCGFGAVLAVTAFTGLVMLPRDILLTILRVRADSLHIYTSPAVFLEPEQKAGIALAEHLDIFALYRLILLGFGFRSISGLRGRQTGWLVAVLWVLGAAFAAGMARLGQAFGS